MSAANPRDCRGFLWLREVDLPYSLGCPPSQDSSHHQDYCIFRIGDPYKPSFLQLLGGGTTQLIPEGRPIEDSFVGFAPQWAPQKV